MFYPKSPKSKPQYSLFIFQENCHPAGLFLKLKLLIIQKAENNVVRKCKLLKLKVHIHHTFWLSSTDHHFTCNFEYCSTIKHNNKGDKLNVTNSLLDSLVVKTVVKLLGTAGSVLCGVVLNLPIYCCHSL